MKKALIAVLVAAAILPCAVAGAGARDDDDPAEYRERSAEREAYRRGYERGFERGFRKGIEQGERRPPPPPVATARSA